MKTIKDIEELKNIDSILDNYSFQPALTDKLDAIENNFDQRTINEIVLWKVNRYAQVNEDCLRLINQIDPNSSELDIKFTKALLTQLLSTKGIRLPMASTILRFRAPNVYQIYDQRVYRYLYGFNATSSTIIEKQIFTYLTYLKDLKKECKNYNIQFSLADRILYQADKTQNSFIPIKY